MLLIAGFHLYIFFIPVVDDLWKETDEICDGFYFCRSLTRLLMLNVLGTIKRCIVSGFLDPIILLGSRITM